MPIPGEHYVLRVYPTQEGHFEFSVLDLAYINAGEAVALIEWKYGLGVKPIIISGGFSIIRFDLAGNITWQVTRSLCFLSAVECADWTIEGHLARTPDGFIAAMTGTNLNSFARPPIMFAVRVDNAGAVKWQRTYKAPGGRITSIAPMATADHYLIAANSDANEAWLFEIDGNGTVVTGVRQPNFFVRRLRALRSQGICAVGEILRAEGGATNAAILNVDPAALTPNWFRRYTIGGEAFRSSLRWIDIAEATQSLLVIGNVLTEAAESIPIMAFLNTTRAIPPSAGTVRMAFEPRHGEDPVRLRGVDSYFEGGVAGEGPETARYTVAGSVAGRPWQFIMQEDASLEWQKRYRKLDRDSGHIGPTVWASWDWVLAGGKVSEGVRSHAILTATPSKIGRGARNCADESDVEFPERSVPNREVEPQFMPLTIVAGECWIAEAPLLKIRKDCLDRQ